jgi:hypothetical protein
VVIACSRVSSVGGMVQAKSARTRVCSTNELAGPTSVASVCETVVTQVLAKQARHKGVSGSSQTDWRAGISE